MTDSVLPLPVEALRRVVDPARIELPDVAAPPEDLFGQERAEEALRFGIAIDRPGFNLFVLGSAGVGKHRMVRRVLEERASGEPVPDDWVYVHCFDDPDCPRALPLPPGRGTELKEAMERLVEDLSAVIPATFESDEYRARRRVLEQDAEHAPEEEFQKLSEHAESRGLRLMRTPTGFAFAPQQDGQVLKPEDFAQLDEDRQAELKKAHAEMESALREVMAKMPAWQRSARTRLRDLDREMAGRAAEDALARTLAPFADLPDVQAWLTQVREDVIEHAAELFRPPPSPTPGASGPPPRPSRPQGTGRERRYRVNVAVDRRGLTGAPVVYEDHPTHDNLIGRVEARQQFGALISDFLLIKAGAVHRANGGYLVIDADRLLASPGTYDTLKRALRAGELRIESAGKAMGLASISLLEPRPIPLAIKVILVGDRGLFYLLSGRDPDFGQLFKVAVDFEDEVSFVDTNARGFARVLQGVVEREGLLPLEASGLARMLERAVRLADDQHKLSTHVVALADVLREADHLARAEGVTAVAKAHVERALEAGERRLGRMQERSLERYQDGTMLIDTEGSVVGQINGLSVLAAGPHRFGRPSRITCRVRLGKGDIVDIEREVSLGGPLHTKGVLILSSFLGATYSADGPLSLRASLVFEQSYGGVDGDSASLAELCCLLSALSRVPIQQRFAVTGSVNQMGEVQAIGGVNEKIEGFFDVCKERGLDHGPGVLIPQSNARHLMLRPDIVEAARAGKFAVYAVRTVDEALAILTGAEVGDLADDGTFPEGTIHAKVEARLLSFADARKRAAGKGDDAGSES